MTSDYADLAQDQLAAQAAAEITRRRVEIAEQVDRTKMKRNGEKRRRRKPEPAKPTAQEHKIDLVA